MNFNHHWGDTTMSKSIIKRTTLLTMSFSFVTFIFANNGPRQFESEEAERQDKIDQGLLQPVHEAYNLEQKKSININRHYSAG